jgi:hypothetical protein
MKNNKRKPKLVTQDAIENKQIRRFANHVRKYHKIPLQQQQKALQQKQQLLQ